MTLRLLYFRCCGRLALLLCAALSSLVAMSADSAMAKRRVPATVVTSQSDRLVFRVDVENAAFSPSAVLEGMERVDLQGYLARGLPGAVPTMSRRYLVGLPPAGSYRVSARVIAQRSLGRHRLEPVPTPGALPDDGMGPLPTETIVFDADAYDSYVAPPLVEPGDEGFIRDRRVLALWVNPLIYDVSTGETILATSIEVTVSFNGAGAGGRVTGLLPESPLWDGVWGRLLINGNAGNVAEEWRVPVSRPQATLGADIASRLDGTFVKLRVRESTIHRVTAATLESAGFPMSSPVASLRLIKRGYDEQNFTPFEREVAFLVEEDPAGVSGVFDANDAVVFYALRLRDDNEQGDRIEKFADHNVYWLGTTPGGGLLMSERTLSPGFVTADTAAASFPVDVHVEIDREFRETTPPPHKDFYYYNAGSEAGPVDFPFHLSAVKPGTSLSLQSELHGQSYTGSRLTAISVVNSKGETILDPAYGIFNVSRRLTTWTLSASALDAGPNQFRLTRYVPPPPQSPRATMQVVINFLNLNYESLYRVRGNALRFNTATLGGDTSITVTGISDTSLRLFDVTVPDAPVHCRLDPSLFTDVGGSQALSFRDAIGARKEYTLLPENQVVTIAAADVVRDQPSSIIASAPGAVDVLVVSYRDFIPQMQTWVRYRRAQGYRVLMVDVEDVFDEFDNGVPSARSIDRFVRHFYAQSGAAVLLLVGDSSEDNKHLHVESGQNFVPSHSWPDHVSSLAIDEVVTSDKLFVKLPAPNGTVDIYPDLIVGRFPVGTTSELQRVLDKTFTFEAPKATDFWRKRIIIAADDEYSEGGATFGGFQFCDHNEPFAINQNVTANIIENSLPAGYEVVRFFLGDYLAPIHTSNCVSQFGAIQYTRANVTELFMNELSKGATLVTMQAHMNRSLLTHERVFSTQSAATLGSATGSDHLRVDNRGKPWVIYGMGCHFSDYAVHKETPRQGNRPNGDALAEQLLFQNNRGAVATYGSSGFEYINETNQFMRTMMGIWFYEAPYDTAINTTQAEWKLGELMFMTEVNMAGPQRKAVERYHILGDPLLQIDAGPPRFEVTLNDRAFTSGDLVSSVTDTITVSAVITDENAIHDFKLIIDDEDVSTDLVRTRLTDPQLPNSRQYRVEFRHAVRVRVDVYQIVLRALQAPDTTAGQYHMAAEFILNVESRAALTVNGRTVLSGASVPVSADYRVETGFPVFVPAAEISLTIDDEPIDDAIYSHPSVEDSTTWLIDFSRDLGTGRHTLVVNASGAEFTYDLTVSGHSGLQNVINYPNPFRQTTSFVYANDVEISDGTIDIFTTSGKRVRRLVIPPAAKTPGENAVFWDGRDNAGDRIANGVYLYVIRVTQRGQASTVRGKVSHLE